MGEFEKAKIGEIINKSPQKDNKELNVYYQKMFLGFLVTHSIANLAPILSLVRAAELKSLENLKITLQVKEVNIITKELITIKVTSELEGTNEKKHTDYNLISFRGFSGEIFEPFVCISKSYNEQDVLAFADMTEFLIETINGDIKKVLKIIKKLALDRRMLSLHRYITIMEQFL